MPKPLLLLGVGVPWDGPHSGPCPTCEGKPLPPRSYCLRCNRWSEDAKLEAIRRRDPSFKFATRPDKPSRKSRRRAAAVA